MTYTEVLKQALLRNKIREVGSMIKGKIHKAKNTFGLIHDINKTLAPERKGLLEGAISKSKVLTPSENLTEYWNSKIRGKLRRVDYEYGDILPPEWRDKIRLF